MLWGIIKKTFNILQISTKYQNEKMNYREKFNDNEWISIYSIPTLFINVYLAPSIIRNSASRVNTYKRTAERYLADISFFESDLMKIVLTEYKSDKSNKALLHFESIKTKPREELEIVAAILNRKITDDEKKEFTSDILRLFVVLSKEIGLTEEELDSYLEEDIYLSMLDYIINN